jgi:hypothetical protein
MTVHTPSTVRFDVPALDSPLHAAGNTRPQHFLNEQHMQSFADLSQITSENRQGTQPTMLAFSTPAAQQQQAGATTDDSPSKPAKPKSPLNGIKIIMRIYQR